MVQAILTTQGLYNYDDTLFEGLNLPEGYDKESAIAKILMETYELEVLFPDFDTLKTAINYWSLTRQSAWGRISRALSEEYNPIHNFDRHEDYTDKRKTDRTGHDVSSSTSNGEGQTTNTDKVNGFNGTPLVDRGQTVASGTNKVTGNGSVDSRENSTDDLDHKGHLYGNIGVTKSQEMVADEIALRQTDFYKIIAEEYKNTFCILVY